MTFTIIWGLIKRVLSALVTALLTQKMMLKLMVVFGEWLVNTSKNELDNDFWVPIKESLEAELKKL